MARSDAPLIQDFDAVSSTLINIRGVLFLNNEVEKHDTMSEVWKSASFSFLSGMLKISSNNELFSVLYFVNP